MTWTEFMLIAGVIIIVFTVLLLGLTERIENLESSNQALRGYLKRLRDNDDELIKRVLKLEHKDGEQND